MLDLAKIEAGVMPLHIIQADINLYLRLIVELFKSAAINKKIQLDYESLNKPFFMDFDPDKILHVMSNLISNALKYSNPNGTIEIQLKHTQHQIQCVIIDNGIGIPPADLEKVFQPFFRTKALNHPDIKGIGVGLSIVQRLCSLLKIDINISSQEHLGTKIVLIFDAIPK